MTDTKFTKGKWVACVDEDSCWVDSVEGGMLADITHADVSNSESDANAHLIAAAPEMYAMIESLTGELASAIIEANLWRNRLINLTTENPPDLIDGQTCHEAQLLLAKARGEEE